MEPNVYGLFVLIILILIGSACCSGVEAAFLAVNSIRILEIASRQKPKSSANQLLKLRKHLGRTLTVITITNNGFKRISYKFENRSINNTNDLFKVLGRFCIRRFLLGIK